MAVNSYRELFVWQKSKDLIAITFELSKLIRDYSFKDQLNRASLSISNNIAEGFGRKSKREFRRFLNIALGSAYEVESMLIIFKELKITPEELSNKAISKISPILPILPFFLFFQFFHFFHSSYSSSLVY